MNKKFLAFGIVGLFAMALVSAGLITGFFHKDINMNVGEPIVQYGDFTESVELIAGDGYRLYLVEGENKLDKDISINARFNLLDENGTELSDTAGFYLAYSEDIEYAYEPEYGNAQNWEEAKTWMFNNLDWFDWYATDEYSKYDSSVITNHNGNSFYPAIAFNSDVPTTISPGKFYAVVYMDVDVATVPGEYTLNLEINPVQ